MGFQKNPPFPSTSLPSSPTLPRALSPVPDPIQQPVQPVKQQKLIRQFHGKRANDSFLKCLELLPPFTPQLVEEIVAASSNKNNPFDKKSNTLLGSVRKLLKETNKTNNKPSNVDLTTAISYLWRSPSDLKDLSVNERVAQTYGRLKRLLQNRKATTKTRASKKRASKKRTAEVAALARVLTAAALTPQDTSPEQHDIIR